MQIDEEGLSEWLDALGIPKREPDTIGEYSRINKGEPIPLGQRMHMLSVEVGRLRATSQYQERAISRLGEKFPEQGL